MRGVTVTTQKRSIVFGGCTVWLLTRILTKLIIKKVPIMKRLFFLIAIAFLMAGCSDKDDENVDMASVGHYVWQNESDHRITLTVIGRFENEVLLPKERISKTMIGFIFPPSPRSYTIEGMKISFDDGSYGGVFSIPTEFRLRRTIRVTSIIMRWERNIRRAECFSDNGLIRLLTPTTMRP